MTKQQQYEPRDQHVPLTADEIAKLDELLERQMAGIDFPEMPPPSLDEQRRYRLGFVYIMSRHIADFIVTREWLAWIWTGEKDDIL
jgi:hypothetical protein